MVVYWVIAKNKCQWLWLLKLVAPWVAFFGHSLFWPWHCLIWSQCMTHALCILQLHICCVYICLVLHWTLWEYWDLFKKKWKSSRKKSEMIIIVCLVQQVLVHEILVIWDFFPLHINGFRRLLKNTREVKCSFSNWVHCRQLSQNVAFSLLGSLRVLLQEKDNYFNCFCLLSHQPSSAFINSLSDGLHYTYHVMNSLKPFCCGCCGPDCNWFLC